MLPVQGAQVQPLMAPHSSAAPSKRFTWGKLTDAYRCPELVQAGAGGTEKCRRAARAGDSEEHFHQFGAVRLPGLPGSGDVRKEIVTH